MRYVRLVFAALAPSTLALALGFAVLGVSSAHAGPGTVQSSCSAPCLTPPKFNLFVRDVGGTRDGTGKITPLVGTLAKGRAKTVLRVDFTVLGDSPSGNQTESLTINGHIVPDGVYYPNWFTQGEYGITRTYWLDLDAAEAAYPGSYVNQPLVISLASNWPLSPNDTYTVSFSVQLVKKK